MAGPVVQAQIRWASNIDELKQNISQGIGVIDAMKTSVDRTVQSLSGNGLFQAANKVTAAIQEMGGATKLTGAEQDRVNTLLEKAIEKYNAMGIEAPQAMRDLADATKKVETSTDESSSKLETFGGLLEKLTERFAIYEVLRKSLDFSKELLESTAKLEDLHLATGIATDDLQRFSYVGKEFGVDTDTMARGVEQLSAKLANGDKNATSAVQMLGLSVSDLLKAGPKEAFIEVAEAAGRIDDPMTKAGVASELFGGKLSKQLLPMLADLRQRMDEVPQDSIISEQTIKSAHDFEVGLEQLTIRVKAYSAEIISGISNGSLFIGSSSGGLNVIGQGIMAVTAQFKEQKKAQDVYLPSEVLDRTTLFQNKLQALRTEAMTPLTIEQKRMADQLIAAKDDIADIAKVTGASEGAIKIYVEAHKSAADAVKKHDEAVASLRDTITNAKVDQKALDLAVAVKQLGGESALSADEQKRLADEVGKLWKSGATLSPELVDLAVRFGELDPKVVDGIGSLKEYGEAINTKAMPASVELQDVIDGLTKKVKLGSDGITDLGFKIKITADKTEKAKDTIGELSKALAQLAQVSGGSFGEIVKDLSTVVAAIDAASKSVDAFKAGQKSLGSGDTLSGILQMGSGILGIASAAISAGKAIVNLVKNALGLGTAGRDAVEDFAATFGGFDTLHEKLDALGASGEALWVKLTQGVGKNDPAAAKAVIDDITKALDGQKQATDDLLKTQNSDLAALLQGLQGFGAGDMLQPYLDKLADAKGLTADNLSLIKQMSGDTSVSFDQMQKAAQALGISEDKLGQSFQNAKSQAEWQSVIDNMDTLKRGGADINDLLGDAGLQKKISDLADSSIKFGTTIPENAKPWIQSLIDQGKLLDASGDKITDINKLNFGESLQTSVQKLVDKIGELIDKISAVPGALDKIPPSKTVTVTFDGKKTGDWTGAGGDSGDGVSTAATGGYVGKNNVIPFASYYEMGGPVFRPRGSDTVPAMLTPGEIILNAAEQHNVAGAIGNADMAAMAQELRYLRAQLAAQHAQLLNLPGTVARAQRDTTLMSAA